MIRIEGYSNRSRQAARKKIEQLKANNHGETIQRNQKVKELSQQTNHLRRKLEEKKKSQENIEEKRRLEILKSRKLKQKLVTEKYQRYNTEENNNRKYSSAHPYMLKDGRYKVRGHIIDIKNGVRVNSALSNGTSENQTNGMTPYSTTPTQQKMYSASNYLTNHVNSLLNENIVETPSEQIVNKQNTADKLSETEKLLRQLDEERQQAMTAFQLFDKIVNSSPRDSLDSNDSLNDSSNSERKFLKSSLRDSNKLRDSINRKVTFSQSIQFDDGNSRPLMTQAASRVPLYKRINNDSKENNEQKLPAENDNITRQNIYLPQYPKNNDYKYPESVSNQANNVAVVSPIMSPYNHDVRYDTNNLSYPSGSFSRDSLNTLLKANTSNQINILNENEMYGTENKANVHRNEINNIKNNTPSVERQTSDFINSLTSIQNGNHISLNHNSKNQFFSPSENDNKRSDVNAENHSNTPLLGEDRIASPYSVTTPLTYQFNDATDNQNVPNFAPQSINSEISYMSSNHTKAFFDSSSQSSNVIPNAQTFNSSATANNYNTLDNTNSTVSSNMDKMFGSTRRRYSAEQVNPDDIYKEIMKNTKTPYNLAENVSINNTHRNEKLNSHISFGKSVIRRNSLDSSIQGVPYCNLEQSDKNDSTSVNISKAHQPLAKPNSETNGLYEQVENDLAELTFDNVRRAINDNEKHNPITKQGSAIPVRVHNNSPSVARRGRIIVSANSKKRKPVRSNFSPHPPPTQQKPQETPSQKAEMTANRVINLNTPISNPFIEPPIILQRNRSSSANAALKTLPGNVKYTSENFKKRSASAPKSRESRKEKIVSNLNKTPTDDEINKLWENVRECLDSDRSTEHAHSDSICMKTGSGIMFERTHSGTNLNRKPPLRVNIPPTNRISSQFTTKSPSLPSNLNNFKYPYVRQPSSDSMNGVNNYNQRFALLPNRVNQIMKSSNHQTPRLSYSNNVAPKTEVNFRNSIRPNEVTDSLHSFMTLEELCTKQSVTPRQVETILRSNKTSGNQRAYQKYGMSALSLEENCVMESLDRLNTQLKERGALIT